MTDVIMTLNELENPCENCEYWQEQPPLKGEYYPQPPECVAERCPYGVW